MTEEDANFTTWQAEAIEAIAGYKNAEEYKADEQTLIANIVEQAQLDLAAATNSTELKAIVKEAKAKMDALWTAEQWDAALAVVEAAKAQLESYKVEDDYLPAQWYEITTIIANAYANIDAAIGNDSAIANIVESAKASMDAVKTAEQVEAEQLVVLNAKAELEAYKTQSDYNDAEWNEILTIIANAYARIDDAIGDDETIASIVEEAKTAMDKVLKSDEANAKAFADAKDDAIAET
jgi:hypothetical protein